MLRTLMSLGRSRVQSSRVLTPTENLDRWREYTQQNLTGAHALVWLTDRWRYEEPLYREIKRCVPPGGRILEVGTGGGPNLLWLASRGYQTTGVDYVPEVIHTARKLAQAAELEITYEVADAFDLRRYRGFDLALSVGMVEHWEYEDSVCAIREQAACASTVIVVIPTAYIRHTIIPTDERFYTRRALRRMLQDAGLQNARVFGYGDVPGWMGRSSRVVIPEIPYRRVLQRHLGWPASSLAAVGESAVR
jgi:SAM-dependent methyltransferase